MGSLVSTIVHTVLADTYQHGALVLSRVEGNMVTIMQERMGEKFLLVLACLLGSSLGQFGEKSTKIKKIALRTF